MPLKSKVWGRPAASMRMHVHVRHLTPNIDASNRCKIRITLYAVKSFVEPHGERKFFEGDCKVATLTIAS